MTNYFEKCLELDLKKGEDPEIHPYALCLDKSALLTLPLGPDYMSLLESRHVELFGIQICTIKKTFTIQSYRVDGNSFVKEALLRAIAPYKGDKHTNQQLHDNQQLCNVSLLPIAVPKFELHVQSYLPKYGESVAQNIITCIQQGGLDYFKLQN
jgi:translation initiation factor 2 alpha subunit (eIF-2alpha)